ncbi:putative glutamine amidotransferase [Paraburkholderia piptadeniae]|uniref:gamma-glutamyl-gamma-aminobutyrate hydrolase n=2 Tax=Paraburkholderia piptadeniae TaxID=1701573 RepID=A0A1N7S9Z9_9BURK|nr:putative glutamine amidotransferase [Paraburkholderia piptadeniae]
MMHDANRNRPLVGVVCDRFFIGEHDLHSAKHSYVRALMAGSRVSPVLIPASQDIDSIEGYLDGVSGLLFPGGASNVEARRYGGPVDADMLVDPDRDHVALELMRGAAARGMPFLAICRGFQEMNVAFGGTLHADIHASGHSADHLEDLDEDLHIRYRYRHDVELVAMGALSALAGGQRVRVNSLHRQGVAALAPSLTVEARAPDGLIEAYRLNGHDFALGVQWHPEAMMESDALSRALFEAFGASCRLYAALHAAAHHES